MKNKAGKCMPPHKCMRVPWHGLHGMCGDLATVIFVVSQTQRR